MKKSISAFMSIVMALIVLMASTNVYANDIAMYTNNTDSVKLMFNISTKGKADVVLKCTDSNNNIKHLKAVIKVQRKIGLVWTTVDNGTWKYTNGTTNKWYTRGTQPSGHSLFKHQGKTVKTTVPIGERVVCVAQW